jgi:DNA-binding transcriptional ArsR family regulator
MEDERKITPGWRMAAFATTELALDAFYLFTRTLNLDLDAFWIYSCVANNTMRNIVLDAGLSGRYGDALHVPDELRPTVSRRAIADKTGLPRETVRRRVKVLVERGLLECDADGNVRVAMNYSPLVTQGLNEFHRAVMSYLQRLENANVPMPLVHTNVDGHANADALGRSAAKAPKE